MIMKRNKQKQGLLQAGMFGILLENTLYMGQFISKYRRLVLVAISLPILLTAVATAQTPTGSGLSISPTLSEFTLKPGQADKVDITLKNITVNPLNAIATINDFESDNSTGNPQLISDTEEPSPNSIRKFIVGLDNVPLAIGEQKKVTVTIQVPKDTPAGAYYGVIRYKASPAVPGSAPAPGEVSLSASVGTIVLVTVPGQIKEQVQLTGIKVYNGPKNAPRESTLFFSQPNRVGVEVNNLGNGFTKPYGTVEVSRTFGGRVYSYQLNGQKVKSNVLPNSKRTFINEIKNVDKPGRYTVTANVSYGQGSDVLVLSKSFWYLPAWLFIAILVIVGILVVAVLYARRRYKKGTHQRDSHRGY